MKLPLRFTGFLAPLANGNVIRRRKITVFLKDIIDFSETKKNCGMVVLLITFFA